MTAVGFTLWGLYLLVWFVAVGSALLAAVGAVLWVIARLARTAGDNR